MYSNRNGYQNEYRNGYRTGPTNRGRPDGEDDSMPHAPRPGSGWGFSALVRDLVTTWRLIWDPAVPGLLKICIPFLALLYFIWPLDLMPGLPFDDIAVVLLASRLFVRLAPQDRVHRASPGGAPHSAYYDFRNQRRQSGGRAGDDDHDVIDTTWRVVDDK